MIIDSEGMRLNVCIILCDRFGKIFLAKRLNKDAWQFPQGGINQGEEPLDAMYREMYEEIGINADEVKLLSESKTWFRYKIPKSIVENNNYQYIGQRQKSFLVKLKEHTSFDFKNNGETPEFDDFTWVNYWFPIHKAVFFKKNTYKNMLTEFLPTYNEHFFGVKSSRYKINLDPLI